MSDTAQTTVPEFGLPPVVSVPATGNLTDIIERNATEVPDRPVYARRMDGEWVDVTAARFRDEVVQVAKGLLATGVQPGDRVALLSRTRYEWTLFDFAIWYAGAVVVPIYPTSSPAQIDWLLGDCGASTIIVETAAHEAAVQQTRPNNPSLRQVWSIDAGCVSDLIAAGAEVSDHAVEVSRRSLGAESVATIVYTSGATGQPKGCMLTHGNFIFEVETDVQILPELFGPNSSTLLFLPLAHVFARIIEIGCAVAQTRMAHSPSIATLRADLQDLKPTFILAVPRVFENVFNSASQQAQAEGRGRPFEAATATAMSYSRALDKGRPGLLLRARHTVYDRLVYSKIRAALGGHVVYAISGGAPLGERLAHYFRGCGLTVLEGYGLTETTAAAAVNRVTHHKIGTVGQPLPGTTIRIADDGEVLIRGPHVFAGYFENPDRTREAINSGGWLHTGDVGSIDDAGFLTITGRKKEIIVTAGGENVVPAQLEDRVRTHPLVSQCMVVGEGRPYVAALITLDREAAAAWAKEHHRPSRVTDLVNDERLLAEIQSAVDEANATVSRAERIRKFHVLPVDWTEANGYVTPTMKLRRPIVMDDFSDEVERLYS